MHALRLKSGNDLGRPGREKVIPGGPFTHR